MITAKAYFDQLFASATEAHQKGNLQKAASLYRQLIRDISGQPDPYHMLALILAQQGQFEQAISHFEQAISRNPKNPIYRNNFAETLQRQNRDEEAIDHLKQALNYEPKFYQAKHKLATVLKENHRYPEAADLFKEVLNDQPKFEPAYFQLGTLMLETGNFKSAKDYLLKSTHLNPSNAKAFNNLAIAHQEWSEYDQAKDCFQKAIQLDSSYKEAIRNMALLCEKTGNINEAKHYLLHLAEEKNNDPLILWKAEMLEPSIFESSSAIDGFREKVSTELDKIKSQKIKIDVDQLTKLDIHPPSVLIYNGLDDLPIKKAYGAVFNKIPKVELPPRTSDKPHVGFVVTGGHEGVFVKCMAGMINRLSSDKLDITVVCSFPNGEKIVKPKISNAEVKFVSLPKSLSVAIHLLTSLNFDFLHYWEVGTDSYNYFIPYFKPARKQCVSWGWPITSGNPQIDYFLSGGNLDSAHDQKFYTEKLVILDRMPVYYNRPELPELDRTKSDFGLNEKSKIYLCAQNLRKVHPDFDEFVNSILAKDENAQIVFLADKQPAITERLNARLQRNCSDHYNRITILERQSSDGYFNILNLADVVLDTLYYNGGANTNCDAFALGIPVVTMPTGFHRGRFTSSAYQQMGFEDLIASSKDEYCDLAVRLANDPGFRKSMSQRIEEKSEQIFEDQQAVRELEEFFVTTFQTEIKNG